MNVLVVAAHPDDEVLGPGGTLALHARRGDAVHVLILGDGKTSRGREPSDADVDETRAAAAVLGVASVERLDLPDNRLDTVALLDVVQQVEERVERHRPEVVYTHHAGDLNVDHEVAARATLTACRPAVRPYLRGVLAFETLSATDTAFAQRGAFRPTAFVDVTATVDTKVEAMAAYASELHPFPHQRSLEAIRMLAGLRGSVVGVAAAEAFAVVWTRWAG